MDKQLARIINEKALEAVSALSTILESAQGHCSLKEFEVLRKGVGLSIGKIQMEILDVIAHEHPDLDDLK